MILEKLTSLLKLTPAMIGCGDSMEKQKRLPLALNRCIVLPVQTETRQREGATKHKGAIMFVTVNRKAIESALLAVPPFINRSNWVTAVCRYGTIAICDSWDDAQDAIMNYIDVHGDEGDWLVRPATDEEVTDTLLVREIEDIEYRVSRDINYPDEFEGAFKRELIEFGYPEDGFIEFDTTPWDYGEETVRFEVSPRF